VTFDRKAPDVSYRWAEHTAEVQIDIDAETEEEMFRDALRALGELLADCADGEQVWREVAVDGKKRAALLVGWLDELVFLAQTEDLVPGELSDRGLAATVRGHCGSPRHVVEAATHHRLRFERSGSGFRATAVLDV